MRHAECKGVFCACPDCRRDAFAAAAMTGIMASNATLTGADNKPTGERFPNTVAAAAVAYADALLAALDGTEAK